MALHDVEPATYERCALIRDWLDDHGVDRVTLLVTPASDMHPFDRRSPELAGWLAERRKAGDAIAQQTAAPVGRKRPVSPLRVRGRAALGGELLRLDIHPADLTGRNVAALEGVLRRSQQRTAVTYDAL